MYHTQYRGTFPGSEIMVLTKHQITINVRKLNITKYIIVALGSILMKFNIDYYFEKAIFDINYLHYIVASKLMPY